MSETPEDPGIPETLVRRSPWPDSVSRAVVLAPATLGGLCLDRPRPA